MTQSSLIPAHGSYRKLKTFKLSRLVYDFTARFCDKFISRYSRTHDQMVQAARSGVQNIAEGSMASGTSKKTELKLTNVARASLEELLCDYEDFLRQNQLELWSSHDPKRKDIIQARFETTDELVRWMQGLHKQSNEPIPQIAANAILTIIFITCTLLKRQIDAQGKAFQENGGFTENLYKSRMQTRK